MCQLLGMNCNVPTDICFSFEGFCARGGKTDIHKDGWGIAFFEGLGCRIFLDDQPSVSSAIAQFIRQYPIRSMNVIAHIRKATIGPVGLENCHPFQRELWGHYWVFAHNGDLPTLVDDKTGFYRPVGQTDSERAFCHILNQLRAAFPNTQPPIDVLYSTLLQITQTIANHGIFNYLLSDGQYFFASCSTRLYYLIRQSPFTSAHLIDEDLTIDFSSLTSPHDRVAIIATSPLTDNEMWTAILPGELVVFREGTLVRATAHVS
ncbi:MAG: class II glutamine amidotransferase [Cyanobacteria bacterium WB6_1B_304]|jgi:glutamine amidotransferase|nr:class II glutamine amidotransferase [Cyanobacteria bacterium WB6_1B_304]